MVKRPIYLEPRVLTPGAVELSQSKCATCHWKLHQRPVHVEIHIMTFCHKFSKSYEHSWRKNKQTSNYNFVFQEMFCSIMRRQPVFNHGQNVTVAATSLPLSIAHWFTAQSCRFDGFIDLPVFKADRSTPPKLFLSKILRAWHKILNTWSSALDSDPPAWAAPPMVVHMGLEGPST